MRYKLQSRLQFPTVIMLLIDLNLRYDLNLCRTLMTQKYIPNCYFDISLDFQRRRVQVRALYMWAFISNLNISNIFQNRFYYKREYIVPQLSNAVPLTVNRKITTDISQNFHILKAVCSQKNSQIINYCVQKFQELQADNMLGRFQIFSLRLGFEKKWLQLEKLQEQQCSDLKMNAHILCSSCSNTIYHTLPKSPV